MASTKPIPIRLTAETIRNLDSAAEVLGFQNRTDIIKLCVKSFLQEMDRHGRITLPLEWREMLDQMDGRRPALKVAESRSGYGTKKRKAGDEQ
jgi:uncharacterized protein (DUF1778 family)